MILKSLSICLTLVVIAISACYIGRIWRKVKDSPPRDLHILAESQRSGSRKIEFDIIAVHGLGAHSWYTWTRQLPALSGPRALDPANPTMKESSRVNWLSKFLPMRFPNGRIMLFGYNADWFFMAPFKTSTEAGKELLSSIVRSRKKETKELRPIIFIAHSFGGIVVKEALIRAKQLSKYDDVLKATCGILFLGTPHRGSKASRVGGFVIDLTSFLLGSNKMLLRSLYYHEAELDDMQELFLDCCSKDLKLYCFYERLPSRVLGIPIPPVVDRASATIDDRACSNTGLDKTHTGLNKFADEQDVAYVQICEAIQEIMDGADNLPYVKEQKIEALIKNTIQRCRNHSVAARDTLKAILGDLELHLPDAISQRRDWFLASEEYNEWSSWVSDSRHVTDFLWYRGGPGTGKTATLAYIVRKLLDASEMSRTLDIIHAFCRPLRDDGMLAEIPRSGTDWILRSLVGQLVVCDPGRVSSLDNQDREILSRTLNPEEEPPPKKSIWSLLVILLRNKPGRRIYMVIDGLDAIKPEEDRVEFVNKLRNVSDSLRSDQSIALKLLVSSLPHGPIQSAFVHLPYIDPFTEVKACLESLKPSAQNVRQDDVFRMHKDTGSWITGTLIFENWSRSNKSHLLLLLGKPGSGKSTLLSKILKDTHEEHDVPRLKAMLAEGDVPPRRDQRERATNKIVASFFYSQNNPSDTSHERMLASLLFQILYQDDRLFEIFRQPFSRLRERAKRSQSPNDNAISELLWTFDELKGIFLVLRSFRGIQAQIYVFLDALDESEDTIPRNDILELFTFPSPVDSTAVILNTVITSRHLQRHMVLTDNCEKLILESQNNQDIDRFVTARMHLIENAIAEFSDNERREYDLNAFGKRLRKSAKGVFLWVSLVLNLIDNLILDGNISASSMMDTLDISPDDLEKLYQMIVHQLKRGLPERVYRAKTWIQWAAYAKRPLDIKEFVDATTTSSLANNSDYAIENLRKGRISVSDIDRVQRALISTCGGFLELRVLDEIPTANPKLKAKVADLNKSETSIQLLHWTARMFLQKDKAAPFNTTLEDSAGHIATTCINYLKLSFSGSSSPETISLRKKPQGVIFWDLDDFETYTRYLEELPFLSYVLTFLPLHLESLSDVGPAKMDYLSEAIRELRADSRLPGCHILSHWVDHVYEISTKREQGKEPGLTVKLLQFWQAERSAAWSSNPQDDRPSSVHILTTALTTAASQGSIRTVRALLAAGASPDALDSMSKLTALQAAAKFGHNSIIECLTQERQQITSVVPGHVSRFTLANTPLSSVTEEPEYRNLDLALQMAAQRGDAAALQSLLRRGAASDARDKLGISPLHLAAARGHTTAVEILLGVGADQDSKQSDGSTPLMLAARNGHEEVVRLLLQRGVNPNVRSKTGQTPLSYAQSQGQEAIIRLLLDHNAKIDESKADGAFFMVPFKRFLSFTGRDMELDALHGIFGSRIGNSNTGHLAALVGMPGIGKTTIAREFAYQVRDQYQSVFWVKASTQQQFMRDYHNIARRLELTGWNDQNCDILSLVSDWLGRPENGPWLMILDDADEVDSIYNIPQGEYGTIIMTSRNKQLAGKFCEIQSIINVLPLDATTAVELLYREIGKDQVDRDASFSIVEALGCHPFAIAHVAGFIRASNITFNQFIEIYRESESNRVAILSERYSSKPTALGYKDSVFSTIINAFQKLDKKSSQLLAAISFFDADRIPWDLLRNADQGMVEFIQTTRLLQIYSLIDCNGTTQTVSIHRVVQEAARSWLKSRGVFEIWKTVALHTMAAKFPNGSFNTWNKCHDLFPHAEAVLSMTFDEPELRIVHCWLLRKIGLYLVSMGRYDLASRRIHQACEILVADWRDNDQQIWDCRALQAVILRHKWRYGEAAVIMSSLFEAKRRILGSNHPQTFTTMNSVASVLGDRGFFRESEDMFHLILDARTLSLGRLHRDTIWIMNNLATIYGDNGQLGKAESGFQQALRAAKASLGDSDPNTMTILSNLATTYKRQGRPDEAVRTFKSVFEGRRKILGEVHPETLFTLNSLAHVFQDLGNLEEAIKLLEEVLNHRGIFMEQDPQLVSTMRSLAHLYEIQGRLGDVRSISKQAFRAERALFGDGSPATQKDEDRARAKADTTDLKKRGDLKFVRFV